MQSEKLVDGVARIIQEKPTYHRQMPFQPIGRLCFYLAIKLSILQESLPTVFTAKQPKDTALGKKSLVFSEGVCLKKGQFGSGFQLKNNAARCRTD